MSRVIVKKELYNWAIDRSKRTVEDLSNKFPKLKYWLSGESNPTLKQLESFAKTTLTPLGFFFLQSPPDVMLPIPHFRTLGDDEQSTPSPNLLETVHTMQRRQDWMRENLIEEKVDKLNYVGSAKLKKNPKIIANDIRKTLALDENWASKQKTWEDALVFLRESMESVGILVFVNGIVGNNTHRKLDPEEFRGFVLVDEYAPLVFVNGSDFKTAQMFTLVHELAHIFVGSSAAFDLRNLQPSNDQTEKLCDQVAAEFLVPENKYRKHWANAKTKSEPFKILGRRFKVSVIVAARRALDLNLITRDHFFDFYNHYKEDYFYKKSMTPPGGQFYPTQNYRVGRKFASNIINAVREGRLLYSEAFKLTGLYGKTFDNYISEIEGGGAV